MGHCFTYVMLFLKKTTFAFPFFFSGYGCGMSCYWFAPVIINSLFLGNVIAKAAWSDALKSIE